MRQYIEQLSHSLDLSCYSPHYYCALPTSLIPSPSPSVIVHFLDHVAHSCMLHTSLIVPGAWFLINLVAPLFTSHVVHLSITFSTPLCT